MPRQFPVKRPNKTVLWEGWRVRERERARERGSREREGGRETSWISQNVVWWAGSSAEPKFATRQCLRFAMRCLHLPRVRTATWLATFLIELMVESVRFVIVRCCNFCSVLWHTFSCCHQLSPAFASRSPKPSYTKLHVLLECLCLLLPCQSHACGYPIESSSINLGRYPYGFRGHICQE